MMRNEIRVWAKNMSSVYFRSSDSVIDIAEEAIDTHVMKEDIRLIIIKPRGRKQKNG